MHLALSRLQDELAPPSPTQSPATLPVPGQGPVPLAAHSSSIPGLLLAPHTTNATTGGKEVDANGKGEVQEVEKVNHEVVEALTRKIQRAVQQANGDPTSGKWSHVHALVRMGCTTGRWVGVTGGVTSSTTVSPMRARREDSEGAEEEGAEEEGGEGMRSRKWVLAETEEQWEEWERECEDERKTREEKGKGKAKAFPPPAASATAGARTTATAVLDDEKGKQKEQQVEVAPKKASTLPAASSSTSKPKSTATVKAAMKPKSSTATVAVSSSTSPSTSRLQVTTTITTATTAAHPSTTLTISHTAPTDIAPPAPAAAPTPAPPQTDIIGVPSTSQRIRAEVGKWKEALTASQRRRVDEIISSSPVRGDSGWQERASSESQSQSQSSQSQGKKQSPLDFVVKKPGAVANAAGAGKDGKDRDKAKGKRSKFFPLSDVGEEREGQGGEKDAVPVPVEKDKGKGKQKEVAPEAVDEDTQPDLGGAKPVKVSSIYDVPEVCLSPILLLIRLVPVLFLDLPSYLFLFSLTPHPSTHVPIPSSPPFL